MHQSLLHIKMYPFIQMSRLLGNAEYCKTVQDSAVVYTEVKCWTIVYPSIAASSLVCLSLVLTSQNSGPVSLSH